MSAPTAVEATGGPAPTRGRGLLREHRRLVVQPLAVLAVLGAYALWLATTEVPGTAAALLTPSSVLALTLEHLRLTAVAGLVVLLVGVPLGVLLTRPRLRRLAGPVVLVANFGQAAPAVGLVVLLAVWLGANFRTAVLALVLYGVLPVLAGTITGLRGVEPRLVEAGRGMGMSGAAVLRRVELPLAVPVMLSGIRTALVLLVGTATLAAFVNGGGLGELVVTGINLADTLLLASGALLAALLALLVDWVARVVEEVARPRGL
ncbi:ABC transporter permease [Pseudokineococcus lusitanus]|uniref:Osmoprotectant transport system permease protein n=1 Tax=Pseudokineococcus lusitanus TaxID=763993 RepID=A0A3N1HJW2_9ACTN|nr:ABC transporter permease [Pseudokineococcus lusitanus]ROP42755.1 osmoprotectant transport system permease protein [Pseudokineococcus lusitanus]